MRGKATDAKEPGLIRLGYIARTKPEHLDPNGSLKPIPSVFPMGEGFHTHNITVDEVAARALHSCLGRLLGII